MNEEKLEYYLKNNIELTKELQKYNNKLANLTYMTIFVAVILIIIMIRIMGWV